VNTTPKLLQVTVVGSRTAARTMGDALAWTLELDASGSDAVVVRAVPRAFRNGQQLPDSEMNGDYMERAFTDLFREIEDNFGTGAKTRTSRK
jgi:hypothetical protein